MSKTEYRGAAPNSAGTLSRTRQGVGLNRAKGRIFFDLKKQIFFLKSKSSEHLENLFNFRER
jgi:hypothetical protein